MSPSSVSGALKLIWSFAQTALASTPHILIRTVTLPYYRLYTFNTIDPLTSIALLASQAQDDAKLLRTMQRWRTRKLTELQFISIACAILAAAVIGAFSWTTIEEAHWLTHGFWHSSLVLSILGILLSASEVTVLHILGSVSSTSGKRPDQLRDAVKRYEPLLLSKSASGWIPRKKMVFTWQCPMMFMSYSVCAFLAGLTILVCTPLIRGVMWSSGCYISVMYLTICAIAGTTYVFCSFWVYHYVDMNSDMMVEDEGQEGLATEDKILRAGFSSFGVLGGSSN